MISMNYAHMNNMNDYYEQAVKKAKIGHLGMLAQTCLKYSYEFSLIIESGDDIKSSIFSQPINRKNVCSSKKKLIENKKDPEKALKLKEEARRKLKQERLNKRLDKKIEQIKREEQQSKVSMEQNCFVQNYSQLESNRLALSPEAKPLIHKLKSNMREKGGFEYRPYKISNSNRMNIRNTYSRINPDIRIPQINETLDLTGKHSIINKNDDRDTNSTYFNSRTEIPDSKISFNSPINRFSTSDKSSLQLQSTLFAVNSEKSQEIFNFKNEYQSKVFDHFPDGSHSLAGSEYMHLNPLFQSCENNENPLANMMDLKTKSTKLNLNY